MRIGKVIDNVWATRKEEALVGQKFMIVKLMDNDGEFNGNIIVAADNIGAGIGDRVLVTQGSVASYLLSNKPVPVDALIVGIIDEEKSGS